MKESYKKYIYENNRKRSNKASSYIKAIDLLCPILSTKSNEFRAYSNIWSIDSVEIISALYEYILQEQRLYHKGKGIFVDEEPKSYWRDRYCSAALKSYREFLILQGYEMIDLSYLQKRLLAIFLLRTLKQ